MDGVEGEGFDLADGGGVFARELPSGDVLEIFVVAFGFAVGVLVFLAEVAAAGFAAFEGIAAEEFTELEEIGDATGFFEGGIEGSGVPWDADIFPEFLAEGGDLGEGALEGAFAAGHSAVVPHDATEFAVEVIDGAFAFDGEELSGAGADGGFCLEEFGLGSGGSFADLWSEVIADGGREDEVAVGEALH